MGRVKEWLMDTDITINITAEDAAELRPMLVAASRDRFYRSRAEIACFLLENFWEQAIAGKPIVADGVTAYEIADAFKTMSRWPEGSMPLQHRAAVALAAKYQSVVMAAIENAFDAE
jgi:hypothetical protein